MAGIPNPYRTLELPNCAPESDCKAAFRRLAMVHHPDRGGDAERFKAINEAWTMLKDADQKAHIDAQLQPRQRPNTVTLVFGGSGIANPDGSDYWSSRVHGQPGGDITQDLMREIFRRWPKAGG